MNRLLSSVPVLKPIGSLTLSCRTLFKAPVKKFYKNVTISTTRPPGQTEQVYEILLDQRRLRTLNGNLLQVPNEQLAHAVAHEWDSQKDCIIRQCMHMTTLCSRAVDNEFDRANFPIETMVDHVLTYAHTDTLCVRATEPDDLVTLQTTCWDPILASVAERYQVVPILSRSLTDSTTMSSDHLDRLRQHLLSFNPLGILGIQACTENLKSIFLTLAMVDGMCSASTAVELSQLEQNFQTKRWGEVESFHDVGVAELNARVSAALYVILSSQTRRTKITALKTERRP